MGHFGGFTNRYEVLVEFLSGTNEDSLQMINEG